jgi:hypothetical protein
MTPEAQKAQELCLKFRDLVAAADQYGDVKDYVINEATQEIVNAAIDEIIAACEYNHADMWNADWWNRVRKEVENFQWPTHL